MRLVWAPPHFDPPLHEALQTLELIAVCMPLVPADAVDVATNENDGHRLTVGTNAMSFWEKYVWAGLVDHLSSAISC